MKNGMHFPSLRQGKFVSYITDFLNDPERANVPSLQFSRAASEPDISSCLTILAHPLGMLLLVSAVDLSGVSFALLLCLNCWSATEKSSRSLDVN